MIYYHAHCIGPFIIAWNRPITVYILLDFANRYLKRYLIQYFKKNEKNTLNGKAYGLAYEKWSFEEFQGSYQKSIPESTSKILDTCGKIIHVNLLIISSHALSIFQQVFGNFPLIPVKILDS